jgi:hypothetical protein
MSSVYLLIIHAMSVESDPPVEANGAYVNVYVVATSEAQAKSISREELAAAGWRSLTIKSVSVRTREDYVANTAGLEYFEQALIDGVVLVAYTYPRGSDF